MTRMGWDDFNGAPDLKQISGVTVATGKDAQSKLPFSKTTEEQQVMEVS